MIFPASRCGMQDHLCVDLPSSCRRSARPGATCERTRACWRGTVALAASVPYARQSTGWSEHPMDDATDVNKVVAAIFAAGMCSAKDNKHENYLAEYEAFLSMLEARDAKGM